MNCPQCGGATWNNAQKNQQRAGEGKKPLPLWACKDKDGCGWVKWPPKDSAVKQNVGEKGAVRSTAPLAPVYSDCMDIAARAVKHYIGDEATAADVVAATATLFIAATNTGRPVKKPVAPPPPPPKPEPEPEREYDDVDADAADLPF